MKTKTLRALRQPQLRTSTADLRGDLRFGSPTPRGYCGCGHQLSLHGPSCAGSHPEGDGTRECYCREPWKRGRNGRRKP